MSARPHELTKASSIRMTGIIDARILSRATRRSTTWTRGLAWAMCGFAEQLEFLATIGDEEFKPFGGRDAITAYMRKAAEATCDFYIGNTPLDGIPYWDTGAPDLEQLGDWRGRLSDPFNAHEPIDSSAAAIGAQGLLRLGRHLKNDRYTQAGLTVCRSLFSDPYLSPGSPITKVFCCIRCIIVPTVGTRFRMAAKIPCGRSLVCGAITMPSNSEALRETNHRTEALFDLLWSQLEMTTADLSEDRRPHISGFRRRTQENLVGGASPIQATNFSMGNVTLEPDGGQVPWHNQEQEEIYFIVEGTARKCASAPAEQQNPQRRPKSGLHSIRGVPSTHEHRPGSLPHDLLLRPCGRCRPLEAGVAWDAAKERESRSSAIARRCEAPIVRRSPLPDGRGAN